MQNNHSIEVDVLGKSGDRYRLKVSVHNLGVHVMGMVIQQSKIEGVDWYVTTPAHKVGARYYHDVTFDKHKELWTEIESACVECIKSYLELNPI